MTEPMTTGQRITALRIEAGLSQEALAQRIGTSQAALSRWETDSREPQLQNVIPLATALGVTVESLLPGAHSITRNLSAQQIRELLTLLRNTAHQLEQLIS
jgi:transcriptional regulator with XRE-family HTH domain